MVHRVLIVDDDEASRQTVREALNDLGYEVALAANGREALETQQSFDPDVIVSDLNMPEMDGIELARRASELDPDIKIMFITGFAAVALNSDSAAPKNAKVLSKPDGPFGSPRLASPGGSR